MVHLLRFRKTHFMLEQLVDSFRGDVVNYSEQGCVANLSQYFVTTVQQFDQRRYELKRSWFEVQNRCERLDGNSSLLRTNRS